MVYTAYQLGITAILVQVGLLGVLYLGRYLGEDGYLLPGVSLQVAEQLDALLAAHQDR